MSTQTKRIVIACDGTWQSSVSEDENIPSNVTKLCRHVARTGTTPSGAEISQIVYYDSGVGTGSLADLEKKRQGATGDGLATNVIEAYNFIVLNYSPGDEIFCFGFSRGAYTARAVAGLVTDIGVMEPRYMQIFPFIYKAYKANKEGKPFRETQAWKEIVDGKLSKKGIELSAKPGRRTAEEIREMWEIKPHGEVAIQGSRKVKIVGVWDTVGSLGVPDGRWMDNADKRTSYGFHNVKLNENIEHAFHALALDERRKAFKPTVWYLPKSTTGKKPELLQVWFPGVHINIGGGSDDGIKDHAGDLEGMSNITFAWMLQCISPYLEIDRTTYQQTMIEYKEWLDNIDYQHTLPPPPPQGIKETFWSYVPYVPLVNPAPVAWTRTPRGWGVGRVVDSLTGLMYNYAGGVKRTPGRCETELWNPKTKEPHWVPIGDMGDVNEYVHPVAGYRRTKFPEEKNSGLEGFKRVELAKGKGFEWRKEDGTSLPEYVIQKAGKAPNFERLWMTADGPGLEEMEWLGKVDRVNGL
ncbi:hypothetical protein BU16DRAFT_619443 [Lophium mytilinum]|uniref:T6SS Phospholipase effector Tle1-like catalytic domain-containing protein n=1 Tax=Lophium mytilinum TaxID=390894 RepID=A0A6A6QRE1_9PEZI|nr:hypothetical protein BU16DRAFT_619443 [Lophium mytilinum]